MCGITGFIDYSRQLSDDDLINIVDAMADTITHRGPDDSGAWVDVDCGVALGFRRLAILDLTPSGHQPMMSANGRYVIIFNGEVYNFAALRDELVDLRHTFRSTSDTEVVLEAVSEWGFETAVKRLNGMFAIAMWDRKERLLHMCRDRIGIKPLYYGWAGNTFLFSSELKALHRHPAFNGSIDRNSLSLYLRHSYIPAPYSIYKGIYKLPSGTTLTINSMERGEPSPQVYWSAREIAERGVREPFTGTDEDARAELDALLRESVRLRMIADVPLGAFLSGGIDSSTVVALMQAQSSIPVRTFSIGFYEDGFNEAKFAKEVAQHLGTEHTELYVTSQEAKDVIPRLPSLYDEPFADASQIPTFLVSEMARRHVTVSLSGDGGDELFAGYDRYMTWPRIWRSFGWIPQWGRNGIAKCYSLIPQKTWQAVFQRIGRLLPPGARDPNFAEKVQKLAGFIPIDSPIMMYKSLVSHWREPTSVVIDSNEHPTAVTDRSRWADLRDFTQQMMFLDMVSYLPDDILVKVDRASMGVSLEARVPLLDDHRVAEFAWRLPASMKVRKKISKWILRQVLYQYVPKELIDRPKMGFAVPIDHWLRGSLRPWAETLLDERRLREEGFFNPQPIHQKWNEHIEGKRNWQFLLWNVLMFQAWLTEYH